MFIFINAFCQPESPGPLSPNFHGATVKSSATAVIAAAGATSFASSDLF